MDEDYTKLDMERVSLNFKFFAKTLLSDPYQKLKIDSEAKKNYAEFKMCRLFTRLRNS